MARERPVRRGERARKRAREESATVGQRTRWRCALSSHLQLLHGERGGLRAGARGGSRVRSRGALARRRAGGSGLGRCRLAGPPEEELDGGRAARAEGHHGALHALAHLREGEAECRGSKGEGSGKAGKWKT